MILDLKPVNQYVRQEKLLTKMEIILERHSLSAVLTCIHPYDATSLLKRDLNYHAVLRDGSLPIICCVSPYNFGR